MTPDASDFFAADYHGWDTDTGKPGIGPVANAIQVWSVLNEPGERTVREAALAFKMTDADVRAAVEEHYWMFVEGPDDDPTKQIICHEGE